MNEYSPAFAVGTLEYSRFNPQTSEITYESSPPHSASLTAKVKAIQNSYWRITPETLAAYGHPELRIAPAIPSRTGAIPPENRAAFSAAHHEDARPFADMYAACVTNITFERFLERLRITCDDFNQRLDALPPKKRQYAIWDAGDDVGKSNIWVTNLALQFLKYKPAHIVTTDGLQKLFRQRHDIQRIISFDDMSYSGEQLKDALRSFKDHYEDPSEFRPATTLYLGLPYLTDRAIRYNDLQTPYADETGLRIELLAHERIPLLGELIPEEYHNDLNLMYPLGMDASLDDVDGAIHRPTVVFDHKIADGNSHLWWVMNGQVNGPDGEPLTEIEFVPARTACYKHYPKDEEDQKKEVKKPSLPPKLDPMVVCPQPPEGLYTLTDPGKAWDWWMKHMDDA